MHIKIIFFFIYLFIFQTIASCTSKKIRTPATLIKDKKVQSIIQDIELSLNDDITTSEQCSKSLGPYYKKVFQLNERGVDIDYLTNKGIRKLIKTSFYNRLKIKEKLKNLYHLSEIDHLCLSAIRNAFRASRYIESYLTEYLHYRETVTNEKKSAQNDVKLEGNWPSLMVNPHYYQFKNHQDLKSGDVILSQGDDYSSLAISKIGKKNSQFSRLSFVYRDLNNKLWVSESRIEIGAIVTPIEVFLKKIDSSSIILRYKDQGIAGQASRFVFEKIKKAQQLKNNILFDYEMDYLDSSKMFGAEIVHIGFKKVSGLRLNIPLYKNKINNKLFYFLKDLGVRVGHQHFESFDIFSPGDMQFDPEFEIIAEWTNPNEIKKIRIKEMVLTKIFEWMADKNYTTDRDYEMTMGSKVSWILKRDPIVKQFLKNKFTLNMNPKQLRLFTLLDKVGRILFEEVSLEIKNRGRPFAPEEFYHFLEKLRQEDYKRWAQLNKQMKARIKHQPQKAPFPKDLLFHQFFHPLLGDEEV